MKIYTERSDIFISGKIAEIAPSPPFNIDEVSENAIREVPAGEVFFRRVTIFGGGSIEDLFLENVSWVGGQIEDEKALEQVSYNAALSDLAPFLQAGVDRLIASPGASMNGEAKGMGRPLATTYLDIETQVKDLVGRAAQHRKNMFQANPLDDTTLFGRCVRTQRMMQRILLRLDSLLLTDKCHAFEKAGFICRLNPQSVRQWIKSAAVFPGATKAILLVKISAALQASNKHCKSALPEFDAAFDGSGNYSEKIGDTLFNNMTGTVNAYNALHKTVSRAARAGKLIDVSRPIKEPDTTAEAAATALAQMAKAQQVVSMIKGAQLLPPLRTEPSGPKLAREYLAAHRAEKAEDTPKGFWAEFDSIAQGQRAPAAEGGSSEGGGSAAGSARGAPRPKAQQEGASAAEGDSQKRASSDNSRVKPGGLKRAKRSS
ncbi:unnamed protein product [Prorocentrum cordatum]|uniref:Uncharacterized protein n=1 Tax=Prorocentrum cordatum TaxID=2364126 RepID=A0ABN9WCV5_9DINO|nr:unnamed protein product [Polarella glacialis]